MKLDRELRIFAERLNSEVRDRAMGGGLSGKKNFRENAFTEIVVEYLSEIGMVENGEVCYCETRVGRGIGKVSGFGFNDDEDTLEVFTSVFLDSESRARCPVTIFGKGQNARQGLCRHVSVESTRIWRSHPMRMLWRPGCMNSKNTWIESEYSSSPMA